MSNFLDDKLYNHAQETELEHTAEGLGKIFNELTSIAEKHFKSQLSQDMTYREGRIMLDRLFNSWDLFARRLAKEDHPLHLLISEGQYKEMFLQDEKRAEIYKQGRR